MCSCLTQNEADEVGGRVVVRMGRIGRMRKDNVRIGRIGRMRKLLLYFQAEGLTWGETNRLKNLLPPPLKSQEVLSHFVR